MTQAENPRKAWDLVNEYLFCSECLVDHPLAFFSAQERKKREDEKRICIGHQGYIRLCQHETISWNDVKSAKGKLMAERPSDQTNVRHVLLKECRHPRHRPAHYHVNSEVAARARPKAELGGSYSSMSIWIRMSWTGHLSIPQATTETRISADEMAAHLVGLRRGAGEYLVPEAGPGGTLPEMRCFDPNYCSCLVDFGDKYPAHSLWSLRPSWDPDGTNECCRSDPGKCLDPTASTLTGDRNVVHRAATLLSVSCGLPSGWTIMARNC